MEQFIAWLLLTPITIGVVVALDLAAFSVLLCVLVAAVWAVLIWGGILLLDDLDFL